MVKFFSALLALSLTSCGSVPLSSMMKLANFDHNDLTSINPEQVKARITINEPAELDSRDVNLALRFEYYGEGEREYQFVLNLLESRKLESSNGWFASSLSRHQYEFDIEPSSINEFRKYQSEFLRYGKPRKYYWTVYYYLLNRPEKGSPIDLDLEIKFSDEEEYFYLLEGATVGIN